MPNGIGQLWTASNANAVVSNNSFDALGNVLSSSRQIGGQVYPFAYGYDLAGSLISETYPFSETYPSGRVVTTSYAGSPGEGSSGSLTHTGETIDYGLGNGTQDLGGAYHFSGPGLISVTGNDVTWTLSGDGLADVPSSNQIATNINDLIVFAAHGKGARNYTLNLTSRSKEYDRS